MNRPKRRHWVSRTGHMMSLEQISQAHTRNPRWRGKYVIKRFKPQAHEFQHKLSSRNHQNIYEPDESISAYTFRPSLRTTAVSLAILSASLNACSIKSSIPADTIGQLSELTAVPVTCSPPSSLFAKSIASNRV